MPKRRNTTRRCRGSCNNSFAAKSGRGGHDAEECRDRARPDGISVLRRRRVLALGRFVRGGRRRLAVADRPHRQPRADPRMHVGHGGARRADPPPQIRRQCALAGIPRPGPRRQAMRDDRRVVRRPPAAGLRHRQPARAGMAHPQPRHQDARPQDRRRVGDHRPAVARGNGRFRGCPLPPVRRLDLAKAGAAGSADVDRRLVRGGDPAHRAVRHRLAGGRRNAGPGRRRHRRHPRRRGRRGPRDRRRPLRRRHPVPLRPGGRSRSRPAVRSLQASAPAATRCAISRSATPRRSSSASPPMSPPESPNSSCARPPAATKRCCPRPAA